MISLNDREKKIAFICLFMAFIYLNLTFVLQPIQDKEEQLQTDISQSYKLLNRNLRVLQNGSGAEERYSKYLGQITQKDSDEKEFSAIVSDVESSANNIGVRIVNIKPGKIKQDDFYNRFYINLSIEGQLKDVMHFLYVLQQEPRYFKADDIQIEKNGASAKITCQILLSRIFVPEKLAIINQ